MDVINNKDTNPYQYICVNAITNICNIFLQDPVINQKIDISDFDYVIRGAMFDHYCSYILFYGKETQDYEIKNAYHNRREELIFKGKASEKPISMYEYVMLTDEAKNLVGNKNCFSSGKLKKGWIHSEHITPKSLIFRKIGYLLQEKKENNHLVTAKEIAAIIQNHKILVTSKGEEILLDGWKNLDIKNISSGITAELIKNNSHLSFLKMFTGKDSEALVRMYFLYLCYKAAEKDFILWIGDNCSYRFIDYVEFDDDPIIKINGNQVTINGKDPGKSKEAVLKQIKEARNNRNPGKIENKYDVILDSDLGIKFKDGHNPIRDYFEADCEIEI